MDWISVIEAIQKEITNASADFSSGQIKEDFRFHQGISRGLMKAIDIIKEMEKASRLPDED